MKILIPIAVTLLVFLAEACRGGEAADPVRSAAYDDGWNIGIAFIVCEMADGEDCTEDLWLPDGSGQGPAAASVDESERKAYFKGHADGGDRARGCLETAIKSMGGDLWDVVEIEGVGMDFERAVTTFQVLATQADWDAHAECISEPNGNPYG